MDITTLAAWGEFLGGIAVVVSLVYLAGQIRSNTRMVRASTTSSTNQVMVTFTAMLADNPEVSRIWWEGMASRDLLPEEDRHRFDPLCQLYFHALRQQFQFQRDRVGSPEEWDYQLQGLGFTAAQSGVREWWREWGSTYPPEFRNLIGGLIREGEAAEPTSPVS